MSGRPSSFTVTSAGDKVRLDSAGAARAAFTVTNTSGQTLKGRLLTRPADPAKPEWFSIAGESVRDFASNAAEQVVVQLAVPPGSTPGSYSFRLDAVSQADPDEDFTEGPWVAFEVAPPPAKKPFPWWIVAVAAGIVLLIVIGIVVFLLVRDGDSKETVVSSGTGTIPGTFLFDVDSGAVTQTGADLFWRQRTEVLRQMEPQGTATLVNLGVRDFDSLTGDQLSKLTYTSTPIPGNADRSNQLVNGDVFAVRSTDGNFAKVKVVSYGRDIGVQWVTFRVGG
ncbi:MAG TPA: hypothetical protein VFT86_05185 [Gaiellaceae bacterium]|nr:hypothetical protein [Gaiellaceae bacterium]